MTSNFIQLNAVIPPELDGLRLDQALAKLFPDYSRARLQSWIREQQVRVDGNPLRPKDKVKAGQAIEINAELPVSANAFEPQALALDICYEDEGIIIVNKPAGLVVHPAPGNPDHTLVNALLHYAPELAALPRAGIVHRLDKDTSGLLTVARNLIAHTALVKQIQAREMKRTYAAIVQGRLISGATIEASIGRHPGDRKRMAVVEDGKSARTHYRIREKFRNHTYLRVLLDTGRTHQIRVHMAHIHHPLVGDPVYGKRLQLPPHCSEVLKTALQGFKRQALHAEELAFAHPLTGQELEFKAPLPLDLQNLLHALKKDNEQQLD